jgi:hypothetical protein
MAGQLAVVTAILATVGAMFAYMGGSTQADAGLFKNDVAIALLTRRKWLEYVVFVMSRIGLVLRTLAWLHYRVEADPPGSPQSSIRPFISPRICLTGACVSATAASGAIAASTSGRMLDLVSGNVRMF